MFGLEAQGNWADLKGSNVSGFIPAWTNNSKIEAFGLFTGQVGYAWNNVLWYVKGGAAVTDDKYRGTVTATGALFNSASETRWGGVVGTGIEFGFAPNWSVAVEYDHLFMGNHITLHVDRCFGCRCHSGRRRIPHRLYPPRCGYHHRSHQLPLLGGPAVAEVLISPNPSDLSPGIVRGFFVPRLGGIIESRGCRSWVTCDLFADIEKWRAPKPRHRFNW